ncbi:hypothetical protein FRC09_006826 [Ceratobasidium sp. 395]|nr:hypothetical protein FRC09_006826 [Ceratobasidium sp. 395]
MRTRSGAGSSGNSAPPAVEETLVDKCKRVLELMDTLNVSFGHFITAVCYGEPTLRDISTAMNARTSLFDTDRFLKLLELCYEPPRPPSGGGKRPVGGRKIIRKFVLDTAQDIFRSELVDFASEYQLDNKQLANMDYISTITANALHQRIKTKCPGLYGVLSTLTGSHSCEEEVESNEEEEEKEGDDVPTVLSPKPPIERHPHFGTVIQVASMAYRLNSRWNVLPKVLTVYLSAKHTAKAVIDLLQQARITMSYSWIRKQMGDLSQAIYEEMLLAVRTRPILMVHDNLMLKYKVCSQRGNHQSATDNGTASTVIILPEGARVFEDPNNFVPLRRSLNAKRIAGTAPELSFRDLDQSARYIANRNAFTHDILELFAMIPELADHKIWNSDKLKRPIGPQQLPSGPEHRLKQFMLPMVNIEENSYSGNAQVIAFLLKHMKLDSGSERNRLIIQRLIIWVGDQMTAHRCTMLQLFRQECINGFERLEPFVFIFALFHCMMALSQAILELFRGSNVGETFGADITALGRQGLHKPTGSNKKGLFEEMTGCKTSEARAEWIKNHSAEDLFNLATKALLEHASSGALQRDKSTDKFRPIFIRRQRELLLYFSLRRALKHGDIDRFEALLPELMYFFIGAGNSNYAKEVYNLLQIITHESTPVIRAAILQYGILVNNLGREDSFYPIDQRQELNNKDIRDYAPPPQNSSWEQYAKISPVIPLLSDYVIHVEEKISGISHSHVHKSVKREQDIQALINRHREHHLHDGLPGRKVKPADRAKDVMHYGLLAVRDGRALAKYAAKRKIYLRNMSSLQQDIDIPTPPLIPQFLDMQSIPNFDLDSPELSQSSSSEDVDDGFALEAGLESLGLESGMERLGLGD